MPTTVSSYSRPEGVFVIFDSFLSEAAAAAAGAAGCGFLVGAGGEHEDRVTETATSNLEIRKFDRSSS